MEKNNLQQLIQIKQKNQALKERANELANELIIEFDINEGGQIARFLKISQGLDNYTAVRVWTEKWLKTYYSLVDNNMEIQDLQQDDTLYSKLKSKFLTYFPQTAIV